MKRILPIFLLLFTSFSLSTKVIAQSLTSNSVDVQSYSMVYGAPIGTYTFFNVSGSLLNLGEAVTITAPTGFEVSDGNVGFGPSFVKNANFINGAINTPIYVKLISTNHVGSYSGNITIVAAAHPGLNFNIAQTAVTVTPRPLTMTGSTIASKVYDRFATPGTLTVGTLTDMVFSETMTATGVAGNYADANVANGKPSTVTYTLVPGTGLITDYSLATQSVNGNITAKTLTISGLAAANKTYDATTTASVSGIPSLVGVIAPDDVSLNGGTGAVFASAAVANNVLVSFGTPYGITGADAGNYSLTPPSTIMANILPKTLLVATDPTIATRAYDGSTTAGAVTVGTLSGFIGIETVTATGLGSNYANKNVGVGKSTNVTYTLHDGLNGGLAANYELAPFNGALGEVTKKFLTVTGHTADHKVYDGNTTATLSGTATLVGVVAPDDVTVTGGTPATFDTKHVGNSKVVTRSNYVLGGADVANYDITQPAALAANITKKPLAVTAPSVASKIYNGSPAAGPITVGTISGFVIGETVTATGLGSAYADANVAVGKATTVAYTLIDGTGGGLASNYSLADDAATGDVTKKPLSITPASIAARGYNGTADVTPGVLTTGTLSGFVGVETVTAIGTAGNYNNGDAGSHNSNVSYALSNGTNGGLAANYSLADEIAVGNITGITLTVSGVTADNKAYDGNTTATLTGTAAFVGVLPGDVGNVNIGGGGSGTFDNKNVGVGKTVTVGAYTKSGSAAGNYTITQPASLIANITKKPLSITAPSVASKIYNGSTAAGAITVGTISGFVIGETVTATGLGSPYADANIGVGKATTVAYTLINGTGGGLESNYSLADDAAAGDITAANPVVTVTAGGPFTYTGAPQGLNAATNTGTGSSYTFSYVGTGATTYGPSATAPTNGGTYTVTATVAADGNYSSASSIATAFSIGLIAPVVTVTAGGPFTYTGAPQGLNAATNTGTGSSYTFSYVGTGATTYGPSATAPTNAGTYTVTATVAADGNYSSASSSATAFSIGVATPVVTPTVGTYTYTGSPLGPNAATNTGTGSGYTFSYVGTGATVYGPSATPPTNVGTYDVTVTVAANGNYSGASSSATAFSIGVATPAVTVTVGGPYIFSGASQGPNAATNTGTGSSYTFSYVGTGATVYGPSATPPTAIGTYTVTATVAANGNFGSSSSSATAFSIVAALSTPVVTATVGGPYTENGSPQGPNAATNTGTGSSYTFSYVGTGATTYGPSATPPTLAGTYTVVATVAANGAFTSASSSATAFTILAAGGVGGGGGGGLESKSLGDAVVKRIYYKALNNENGVVDYNKLPLVEIRNTQNRVMGSSASEVTLSSIMPTIAAQGFTTYNSSPKDLTNITNAKEVLAFDFTANKEVKAVAFATKTLGELYDHTKPICDRLKGATLVGVENMTIDGLNFVKYTINNENGQREFATSFSVGTKSNRQDFSFQSTWLTQDYLSDETMYNFQLWAGSSSLVTEMVKDILSKVKAIAAITSIKPIAIPATYVESGKRNGQNLQLVVKNATANTNGYFKLEDKSNETSANTVVRTIPFTVNANGKSNVVIPMEDKYESTLTMYINGEAKDVLYMSDGTWTVDYNKSTTVLKNFTVSNDNKRTYIADEYPLFRNVDLQANSSDFISIVKLLKGGGTATDMSAYKGLKFTAAGGHNLHMTLVKNGIVDYKNQYAFDMPLEMGQKEYYLSLDKFISKANSAAINANDLTAVIFTVEVGTGRNASIATSFSNISFSKEDLNYLNSLEAKTITAYPNPVTGTRVTVNFSSAKEESLNLRITDMNGRIVASKTVAAVKGMNTVQVQVSTGLNAVHVISLEGNNSKYNSTKLTIMN